MELIIEELSHYVENSREASINNSPEHSIDNPINKDTNDTREQNKQPVQYREFVAHTLHKERANNDAAVYFRQALKDIKNTVAPFHLLDIRGDGSRLKEARKPLPADLAASLRGISREMRISPASVFHAAWAVVVSTCSGCDDAVFGTVLSGRLQGTKGAERMLGLFVNTLPLRVSVSGLNANQLIRATENSLSELLYYEQTPLSLVQKCSGVRDAAPLFSSVFNYRHSLPHRETEREAAIASMGIGHVRTQERSNYPVNISVTDFGDGFSLEALVDCSVAADRVLEYFRLSLHELVDALQLHSHKPVSAFNIMPEAERSRLKAWSKKVLKPEECPVLLRRFLQRYWGNTTCNPGLFILDNQYQLTPVGVVGNVYCALPSTPETGVAQGVVANPIAGDCNENLFHCGLLARWLPDGALEYYGCSDLERQRQCGALEKLLLSVETLAECAVVHTSGQRLKPVICGVLHNSDDCVDLSTLRHYIRQQSPVFALPMDLVLMDDLPKHSDGRLDRQALENIVDDLEKDEAYVAPRTVVEKTLANIWSELLRIEVSKISVTANFFALGGHSLLATRLINTIRLKMNLELPLTRVFEQPLLSSMAELIAEQKPLSDTHPLNAIERDKRLPLSFAQQRLWFLACLEGDNAHYNIPLALSLTGELDRAAFVHAFEQIVARHEILRTRFETVTEKSEGFTESVCQVISDNYPGCLKLEELSCAQDLRKLCQFEFAQPFNLSHGPLWR
ncbi:MAG: condensation domain-containing protein, partial [Exilibacterium sp.]